ncbi:preprotein translocase subunit YajC [Halomonas vilamensis]|uniref:Preprotein translocase subunit YajC n=1 Tax=Vreelandella vilamensis TaxID=531309 RepID=A0ABU1H7V1_9GAMM|nr:preprotein translocase subunit YajC [Halomonas vilamensis]MDR5899757.1 preprotein translocase subunit YajC [Halomonas vilamensis]
MEWLLIVFVLMLVAAPVMWLQPSPRQKRQMQLRKRAREHGVEVKIEPPPLHYFKGTMPAYRWRYPMDEPGPDFLLVREEEASEELASYHSGWRWRIAPLRPLPDEVDFRLKALLERLPQDAVVLQSNEAALILWWWESQTGERFVTYVEDFQQLRDGLRGRADRPRSQSLTSPASSESDGFSG